MNLSEYTKCIILMLGEEDLEVFLRGKGVLLRFIMVSWVLDKVFEKLSEIEKILLFKKNP